MRHSTPDLPDSASLCEGTRRATVAILVGAVLLVGLLGHPAVPAAAQTVQGELLERSTGQPVARGVVELMDTAGAPVASVIASDEGLFTITAPRPGAFLMRASRIGFESSVDGIFEMGRGDTLFVEFRIEAAPIAMDSLRVVAEGRSYRLHETGFYQRRDRGLGRFVERRQIERWGATRVTDLFERISMVDVVHHERGRSVRITSGRVPISLSTGTCSPRVFIDGILVFDGRETAWVDEVAIPDDLEGIEVYAGPSETPLQYAGSGSPCGVILMWTRNR